MSNSDPPPPEPTPWDRVGMFFGDVASVSTTIANRNLKLWMTSAPRAENSYRPDWQADWTRWMEIAAANTRDAWALWLGLMPREKVAYPLPIVCLECHGHVDENGVTRWKLSEQVLIPVAWAAVGELPEFAKIEITGSDPAGVAALRACLRVRLGNWGLAYRLESYDVRDLWPGLYTGIVFVDGPTRYPIAQLRIVVHGRAAAPTVPTVVLRWGLAEPVGARRAELPVSRWLPAGPIVLRAPQGGPAPPQHAFVALAGENAEELASSLTVTPDSSGQAYLLHAAPPAAGVEGYYTGAVYATSPEPRALANLEVIVEAPAPARSGAGD